MVTRKAEAIWEGSLLEGIGEIKLGRGVRIEPVTFSSRFEDGAGTNPEELIGAAQASCFSMALSSELGKSGFTPIRIHTEAEVRFEKLDEGFTITHIHLTTEAEVPNIDDATFLQLAEVAKATCPVARALTAVDIGLSAHLIR
jgi:osmotically inducible protein OsmC